MIRLAEPKDMEDVVAIYNQAISARFQTAVTEPLIGTQKEEWFDRHLQEAYPMLVYKDGEQVLGWFSVSPYRQGRAALRKTVEISYFINSDHQGKGIGSQLLQQGLEACRHLGYKTALAIILDKNVASVRLMEKFGFEKWAYLPGVAEFDGGECGHLYYGLRINL